MKGIIERLIEIILKPQMIILYKFRLAKDKQQENIFLFR